MPSYGISEFPSPSTPNAQHTRERERESGQGSVLTYVARKKRERRRRRKSRDERRRTIINGGGIWTGFGNGRNGRKRSRRDKRLARKICIAEHARLHNGLRGLASEDRRSGEWPETGAKFEFSLVYKITRPSNSASRREKRKKKTGSLSFSAAHACNILDPRVMARERAHVERRSIGGGSSRVKPLSNVARARSTQPGLLNRRTGEKLSSLPLAAR